MKVVPLLTGYCKQFQSPVTGNYELTRIQETVFKQRVVHEMRYGWIRVSSWYLNGSIGLFKHQESSKVGKSASVNWKINK